MAQKRRIVVVGSGVFGLSTVHALLYSANAANLSITVVDARPFPSHETSSIDSSRIVRSDYKASLYARLGAAALKVWRGTDAGVGNLGDALTRAEREGREDARVYWQCGLALVYNNDDVDGKEVSTGGRMGRDEEYVKKSVENAKRFEGEDAVRILEGKEEIRRVLGTGGESGDWGYVNYNSGFVNAERAMVVLREEVVRRGEELGVVVEFVTAEVVDVVVEEGKSLEQKKKKVRGVKTKSGEVIEAGLVVFATGAWTPSLLDLEGNAVATGQVIAYLDITEEEQKRYKDMPVILNLTDGTFVIPPRDRVLKVAAHTNGYRNTVNTRYGRRSVPVTHHSNPELVFPKAAESLLHKSVNEILPGLTDRPFSETRICWYTDTPSGDFLVDYHPAFQNLFVATGGSGHAFKFLPVLGREIVGIMGDGDGEDDDASDDTASSLGVRSGLGIGAAEGTVSRRGGETGGGRDGGGGEDLSYREAWRWRGKSVNSSWTGDGSRGGREEGDGELFPMVVLQQEKIQLELEDVKAKL